MTGPSSRCRFQARYHVDDHGSALALADLEAATLDAAMAEALKRTVGLVAAPFVVVLYESDVPVARCVDCFDGKGGTWSVI